LHLYCGIDWATAHHDVAVIDGDGRVVARGRVGNDAAGFAQLLTLLAQAGDTPEDPIPVAIETDRGLWVAALRATGRVIYPINPLAASRYRTRYAVSGRNPMPPTRCCWPTSCAPTPPRTGHCPPTASWARPFGCSPAQQDAVWTRQQIGNQIRDLLKDFYPAALAAFAELPEGGLARADARTILAAAPTPTQAAALSPARLRRLLVKAGAAATSAATSTGCATFHRHLPAQPPQVEAAIGIHLGALLRQFDAACTGADELAEAAIAHFDQHPDAEIITSFPGLGMLAGARVLAEIGDDRARFADARGLKAFAGSAPITRASGKKTVVLHRHIKNRRLAALGPIWALGSLRAAGDWKPPSPTTPVQQVPRPTPPLPANRPALQTNTGRFHLLSRSRLDF
jgi:transposase